MQIKTKMAAVNKNLKLIILQQVNVISILLLQILAVIEHYQYSIILHITFNSCKYFRLVYLSSVHLKHA